nr:MAG TPA: hypothetical protein [Caudoviricetes sp.]
MHCYYIRSSTKCQPKFGAFCSDLHIPKPERIKVDFNRCCAGCPL